MRSFIYTLPVPMPVIDQAVETILTDSGFVHDRSKTAAGVVRYGWFTPEYIPIGALYLSQVFNHGVELRFESPAPARRRVVFPPSIDTITDDELRIMAKAEVVRAHHAQDRRHNDLVYRTFSALRDRLLGELAAHLADAE